MSIEKKYIGGPSISVMDCLGVNKELAKAHFIRAKDLVGSPAFYHQLISNIYVIFPMMTSEAFILFYFFSNQK